MVFFIGQDDGEVASHNNMPVKFFDLLYKPPEIRVHFGGTTGKVYSRKCGLAASTSRHCCMVVPRHDFFTVRPGIYMAMPAHLVAHFANIHLEDIAPAGFNGNKPDCISFCWKGTNAKSPVCPCSKISNCSCVSARILCCACNDFIFN